MSDIDWNYYSMVGYTETWKVVCLSLGIDPKDVEVEVDHYASMLFNPIQKIKINRNKYKGDVTQAEIDMRYEIIEKRKLDGDYGYGDYTLDVEKFVKWANILNLQPFPEKFLFLFKTTENSNTENEKAKNQKNYSDLQSETSSERNTYSKAIERVFRENIKAGKSLPNMTDLLKIFEENMPAEIHAVDVKKKTITYLTRTGEKIADRKAIEAAMIRVEKKINSQK